MYMRMILILSFLAESGVEADGCTCFDSDVVGEARIFEAEAQCEVVGRL